MSATLEDNRQGVFRLNVAKREDKEVILDFLGGREFLKENMPYINGLLKKSEKKEGKLKAAQGQVMDFQAYYDVPKKRLYMESSAALEGENQFSLTEIKVEQSGKAPVRFKQVRFGENRLNDRQYLELEPEELDNVSIRSALMWKNGEEEILQNQMCLCEPKHITRLFAGIKNIELKDPVKKEAVKEKEIVISYGRRNPYKRSCDYEISNTTSKNKVQMIRIPLDMTVHLDKGEFKEVDFKTSTMRLIGNKGTVINNEKLSKNLCISGTNPFHLKMEEKEDWGTGLRLSGFLQNDNFQLVVGIVFKTKDGANSIVEIQSADVPQPYAGGFRMDIPMLKLYWGCLGKDTLVEKCGGELCAISKLKAGDQIKVGKTGEEGVVRDILKGHEEWLWKLEAEDGRILLMTKEHPILCKDGWRTIGDLADGDELYSVKENSFVKIRYVYPVEYNDDVYNLNIEYLSEEKGFLAEGFLVGDYEMQNNIIQEQKEKAEKLKLPDEIKEQIKRFAEN